MSDKARDAAVGRLWRDEVSYKLLSELAALSERMGGHPGEREAAKLVANALANAGVREVQTDSFEMQRWNRGHTELAVVEPVQRSFEALALPYSPPGELEAELVDVGYGTPEEIADADVRGKVAVASTTTPPGRRFVHRMESFGHAVAGGAEAFVFANHEQGQLPPTGSLRFGAEAAAPGIGVSYETGQWLRKYAGRGGRVSLQVDASTEPATSQNVYGVLDPDEPSGETADEIVAVAHYDAHDVAEGALDNGCGVAVLLGTAHLLTALDLGCRVRLVGVGCEEVGLLGAEALAESLDRDRVRAVVNLDGVGRFRDLRVLTHTSEALGELVGELADETGHPIHVDEDPHPYSDHWPFLRDGVPSVQLHSQPPGGGKRGRGWGHTEADTLDKVDSRNLRNHAILTALLIEKLSRTDPSRIDEGKLRAALRGEDLETGMKAADVWPEGWG